MRSQSSSPAPSARRRRKRRGGARPGAGAPRGNLNALKHGRRSTQFAMLGALLAASPKARDALLALARRHQLHQQRADQVAGVLFALLLQRARDIAQGRLSVQSPIDEWLTNKEDTLDILPSQHGLAPENRNCPPHNQTLHTARPAKSKRRYKNPPGTPD